MKRAYNKHTTGLRCHGAVYRSRVQTGSFSGKKRTLWNEFDQQGVNIGSYWEDDRPNAPIQVYYS